MDSKTAKKRILSVVVFFISLLPLNSSADPADTVRVAFPSFPSSANILEPTGGSIIFVPLLHQSVLGLHPKTGQYVNDLAESVTIMPSKKDIMIKLRKGPKFTTGDPVTAYDTKFTHDQVLDPSNANIFASFAQEIEDYEVIDDYTYIVHFYEPYGPWRQLLLHGVCSKNYYDKVGKEKFRENPVGSGPFRFVKSYKGEKYVLEAVENHHDKKIAYKTLELISVPDEMTRLAMLETNELDLVYNILPHQLERIKKNPRIKIKKTDQYPSLIGITGNMRQFPIMEDKKLRMAMQMGVNRQEIVDQVLMGEGYPLYQDASKIEMGYNPNFKIEFNPVKARDLVKASNYETGTPLIMSYNNMVPMAEVVAQIFQQYMKNIGVTIKLQRLEPIVSATYSRNKDKRLGHMNLYSFAPGVDPYFRLMLTIVSDGPYSPFPNRQNQDQLDKLCYAQAREPDNEKRLAILKNIQTLISQDPASVKLFGIYMIYAMRDHIDYTWVPRASVPAALYDIKIVKPDKTEG
ncbi:MAG: ABC transporter substrate-binding protein [Desulfobacterales bacterium]|nr:ABC transporter substrate-binding protein [Desulfobacterales bacterium]